jgi:serine O-acetyltransferase
MKLAQLKYLVFSDYYRLTGSLGGFKILAEVIAGDSFKYLFWLRVCRYAQEHPALKYLLNPFTCLLLRKYGFRFGIAISPSTEIGSGFYIGHYGSIVVNPQSRIGKNCNISHDVTIGQANRGRNKGSPTIGDNVYIGPGARIVGAVKVGNNVAIGANCVVTKDVPDNAVVVGIPGKVISYDGALGYVNKTEYDLVLENPATMPALRVKGEDIAPEN